MYKDTAIWEKLGSKVHGRHKKGREIFATLCDISLDPVSPTSMHATNFRVLKNSSNVYLLKHEKLSCTEEVTCIANSLNIITLLCDKLNKNIAHIAWSLGLNFFRLSFYNYMLYASCTYNFCILNCIIFAKERAPRGKSHQKKGRVQDDRI